MPAPAIDFVLDETGAIIAGPAEHQRLLAAVDLAALLAPGAAAVQLVAGFVVTLRRIQDPARPWLIVQLTPVGPTEPAESLTRRQLEVARLAAIGRRAHEIGTALGCSVNTVRSCGSCTSTAYVSNRVELLRALEGRQ